jgi:hypothetical protein
MMKRFCDGVFFALIAAPALAAELPSRTPGLWQSTTNVTGPDGKLMPHGSDIVTVSCVDALDDQKFFTSNQSDCSSLTISGSGNQYSIGGTCNQTGQTVQIHEVLTYAGPQALQLKATYQSLSGPMTVTSQLQWQGPCLPGMVPGDEGNVTDGAFSKTDNINDSFNQ